MEYVLSAIGLPQNSFRRVFSPVVSLGQHVHDHFIPTSRNNYHPHILGHRALVLFSGLLIALKIFTIAALSFGPVSVAFSSAITVTNIINLTNQSREQNGEADLNENAELDQAAQAKANDMLAKGYFAHVTPSGQTPWDFIVAAGYSYLMAGENLAVNFTDAESVETAWMNSPEHRANLLNKNFVDIGVGISQGEYEGHNAIFVVQEFGTPAAQQITLSNQPTQVQVPAVPAPKPVAKPAASAAPVQTQVRGASSSIPLSAPAAASQTPPPVTVESGNVTLDGDNIDITAQSIGPVVKLVAYFGDQAVMLSPQSATSWSGSIPMSALAQQDVTVRLRAYGTDGQTGVIELADFSPNTIENYNLAGTTPTSYVTLLGHTFNPNAVQNDFYLLFIAVMLSSLILAIAVKKHIQHLSLIANSSFVIILAVLLWWGG